MASMRLRSDSGSFQKPRLLSHARTALFRSRLGTGPCCACGVSEQDLSGHWPEMTNMPSRLVPESGMLSSASRSSSPHLASEQLQLSSCQPTSTVR